MSYRILQATTADVDRLVEYGQQFWHQTLYYDKWGVEYDVEDVTTMTKFLLEFGLVLYAEDDEGEPIGLMLVIAGPFPMNTNYRAATEWVFYVDPAHRKSGLGQQMIEFAETELRSKGVKFLTMVSLSNVQPEAAEGLYRHLGYEHTETSFTKDLG